MFTIFIALLASFVSAKRITVSGMYNTTGLVGVCPDGFVIPDDPSDDDVQWVNSTACAVACISPVRTAEEWVDLDAFALFLVWISELALLLLGATLLVSRERKRITYLVYGAVGVSALPTTVNLLMGFVPLEQRFCRDNANALRLEDGLSWCLLQSFTSIYGALSLLYIWGIQVWNIFVVIVLRRPDTIAAWEPWYKAVIYGLPLVTCISIFALGAPGYAKGNMSCFTHEFSGDMDVWHFFSILYAMIAIVLATFFSTLPTVLLELSGLRYKVTRVQPVGPGTGEVGQQSGSSLPLPRPFSSSDDSGWVSSTGVGSESAVESGVAGGTELEMESGSSGSAMVLKPRETADIEEQVQEQDQEADGAPETLTVLKPKPKVLPMNLDVEKDDGEEEREPRTGDAIVAKKLAGGRMVPVAEVEEQALATHDPPLQPQPNFAKILMSQLRTLATPLIFVAMFLLCSIGMGLGRALLLIDKDYDAHSRGTWMACIFNAFFDSYSSAPTAGYGNVEARQQFAYNQCGDAPVRRGRIGYVIAYIWFMLTAFAYGFFVTLALIRRRDIEQLVRSLCGGGGRSQV